MQFTFELTDPVALKFDKGIKTADLGRAFIIRTFPGNRSVSGAGGECCEEENRRQPTCSEHPKERGLQQESRFRDSHMSIHRDGPPFFPALADSLP
jgi:hypothetical protein